MSEGRILRTVGMISCKNPKYLLQPLPCQNDPNPYDGSWPDLGSDLGYSARSLKRWIFPLAVFGSSSINSIQRGYLNGARRCLVNSINSLAKSGQAHAGSRSTQNAFGLISSFSSGAPITAASMTVG